MLKKKIEKFSRKLEILDEASLAQSPNYVNVPDAYTSVAPHNEMIIPLNGNTIIKEDVYNNGETKIEIETVPSSSSSPYRPNPKMAPNFPYDLPPSDAISGKSNDPNRLPTLNEIQPSHEEKFDDDKLLELFYGNYSDGINSENDQISNDTNFNSK